jgi:hypothetical protein
MSEANRPAESKNPYSQTRYVPRRVCLPHRGMATAFNKGQSADCSFGNLARERYIVFTSRLFHKYQQAMER